MTKIKVITILGTRPEIIRLSCVINLLDKYINHVIVHTGQNYDYELNQIFFEELGVRRPDYFLEVDTTSLGTVLGMTLIAIEKIFENEKPDAVLILGDTNSSIAAIMARRMQIPIYHMEAGNRCFDLNVPEEINRKIIDHISDFNLVYTEHARRHLLSEGIPHRRIYLTGSPMREVIDSNLDKIRSSPILDDLGLTAKQYFLASIHREENVDYPDHLQALVFAFNLLWEEFHFPVIVSTHPRTQKRLAASPELLSNPNIRFLKPFGYFDYNHLQMNAFCVVSDSGTISEETAILGFPAITVRNSMERPEALDTGNIIVTGLDSNTILESVKVSTSGDPDLKAKSLPAEYCIDDVSQRVLKIIVGTHKLSNIWDGIRKI